MFLTKDFLTLSPILITIIALVFGCIALFFLKNRHFLVRQALSPMVPDTPIFPYFFIY